MAGRGPAPKPDHLRQRRNKLPNAAILPTEDEALANEVPVLPARELDGDKKPQAWHPQVLAWWESVWRSPMASEYLDADMKGGLYLLADLQQQRWDSRDKANLSAISAEIRLQEVRFGLSPVDRSRLRWVISQGEEAEEKTQARREGKQRKPKKPVRDPRTTLKMVG